MKIIAATVLLLAFPSASNAASTHKEFSRAWEDRDKRYSTSKNDALAVSQAAWDAFSANANRDETIPKLKTALETTFQARYIEGRGQLLRDFRIHMHSKPSRQLTELWVQERIERTRFELQEAQRRFSALSQIQFTDIGQVKLFMEKAEPEAIYRGHAHGAADELILINQNLTLYFQGTDIEKARNAQRRAALAEGVSEGFKSISNSYNAAASRNWSARCTTNHNVLNCYGN